MIGVGLRGRRARPTGRPSLPLVKVPPPTRPWPRGANEAGLVVIACVLAGLALGALALVGWLFR